MATSIQAGQLRSAREGGEVGHQRGNRVVAALLPMRHLNRSERLLARAKEQSGYRDGSCTCRPVRTAPPA